MTDLQRRLERLAERGTHRPMDDVIDALQAAITTTTTDRESDMLEITTNPTFKPTQRARNLAFAAAMATVAVATGLLIRQADAPETNSAANPPATATESLSSPAPAMTLPPNLIQGVPVTVLGSTPDYSYRLTDDVEIGWNSVDDQTQFCWRTPISEACGAEPSLGTAPIAVAVSPGQTVAIVAADLDLTKSDNVELTLTDGSTIQAGVTWSDDPITIGWARFDLEASTVVSTATTD